MVLLMAKRLGSPLLQAGLTRFWASPIVSPLTAVESGGIPSPKRCLAILSDSCTKSNGD